MVFSSPIFLFLFLPVVLTIYALLPGTKAKNLWLLLTSLVFYAWGEVVFVFLMLGSALLNYFLGRWVDRETDAAAAKSAISAASDGTVAVLSYSPDTGSNR